MKHLHNFLLALSIILLTQCAQPDPTEMSGPAAPAALAVESFAITPEEAAAEGREALAAIAPETRAGTCTVGSIVLHGAQAAVNPSAQVDPSLYVVNFEREGGFAIVAADRRQPATVYAVSDQGAFPDPATLEDGPLKFLYKRIGDLAAKTPPAIKPNVVYFKGPWRDIERVDGLVKTRWGVGKPYNQTREVTAFCQIMSYHKFPRSYDWNLILGTYPVSITDMVKDNPARNAEIARLFADVATEYQSGELKNWIGEVGYTCALSVPYTYAKVVSEIKGKRPVFAYGSALYGYIPQSYPWVMDGYLVQERTITASPDPVRPGEPTEPYPADPWYETRTLVHCNLGNDGKGNGFYLSTLFDLHTGADVPDSGNTGQSGYVDGQIEYSPSDIRITTNIKTNYSEALVDTVGFIGINDALRELEPKP